MMAKSMEHWNGNQMVVIDTETTGLEAGWHEMIQVCMLPLDSNLNPRKDVNPFYILVKPDHPERADKKAMEVNQLTFAEIGQKGHDRIAAIDLFQKWVEKLGLPYTKYGNRKQIIPLGQNYAFDKGFIEHWLGVDMYVTNFYRQYRDTMIAANFLNDRAAFHAEAVPFPKQNLSYLATKFGLDTTGAHDALADCLMTAKVYQKMIAQGLLG